jgi:PAS domain S-box-containing protein
VDYRRIFENLPGLFLLILPDADLTIAGASDAYLRATFTEREAVVGRRLFDVFPGNPDETGADGEANLRASLLRVIATRAAHTMPVQKYDVRRPASEGGGFVERYWSLVNAPILGTDGEVEMVIHRVEEATERVRMRRLEETKRAELVEANHRFQAIYDQGLFAGRIDLQGIMVDVNRSALVQCGFVSEDVIGKAFWECGWWNRAPEVKEWVRRAVAQAIGGQPFHGESRYFWADGTPRVVDFACMPIRDEAGKVVFVVATGMDITERVAAASNLRASEILDSMGLGFFTLDRDFRFTYVNQEALRILERPSDDLAGRNLWEVYPALEGTEFERTYRLTLAERTRGSFTAFYPVHERWYEVASYPASDGIAVYFRDVTAQKAMEAERERLVAESERQRRLYEAALSNTPDLVYIFGLDHRFVYANEALLAMWGMTRDEALQKDWQGLGYEAWHSQMHDREIDQVIATRQPVRGEVPFSGTAGRRVYDYIFAPVLGPDGAVVAVAGTTRDVTERQEAEQAIREQAARLVEADRAKDDFLATLSPSSVTRSRRCATRSPCSVSRGRARAQVWTIASRARTR